jgi:hypothetical protein
MTARYALLLSGLPRQWRTCLPTQLALFEGLPLDVFFHFWDVIPTPEKAELIDLLRPRAFTFERPLELAHHDADPLYQRDNINVPSRLISQYASWRRVGALFAPLRADYRFAVRSRSDLHFVRPIATTLAQLQPDHMLVPWNAPGALLSDLFAIGAPEAMTHYHDMLSFVRAYAPGTPFNPECLLMRHLAAWPGLKIITGAEALFYVRRPHMDNYTTEQALAEEPGRSKWHDPEIVAEHKAYFQKRAGEAGVRHVEEFAKQMLK